MTLLRGIRRLAPRYVVYVLAAGFSAGFALWTALHRARLAPFVFNNQLPLGERNELLGYLGVGVVLALCTWLSLSLLLERVKRLEPANALTYTATWFALLAPSGLLPVLLLPNFGSDHPFLAAFLITGLSAFFYLCVREIQAAQSDVARLDATEQVEAENVEEKVSSRVIRRRGFVAVALLSATYGVLFSIFTVSEHNTFHTHAYDLGIFDQVMYYATNQGKMLFTVVQNPPSSFWGVHFSPVLYLLTPFYALYQDARTLLVAQSALLGAGAVVLYALTLHLTKRTLLALALSVSYLLYSALHGVNSFDFHEVAFAPLLLLLTLYCLEKDRLPLFWLFLTLSLLIKEDVALTGAAIGLYILARGRLVLGLMVTGLCTAFFFTVVQVLIPYFGNGSYNLIEGRFGEVVAPGSQGLVGVIQTGLSNPLYLLFYVVSNPAKLAYLLQLFVPVLFLPLLAGRAWLVILPALATALLSSFAGQFSIGNQYPAVVIPLVYFLAALGLSRVPRVHHTGLVVALVASSLLMMNYHYGGLLPAAPEGREQLVHPRAESQGTLQRMLAQIPPQASVAATGTFVPHLSSRPVALMLPHTKEADFVLADLRRGGNYWPITRAKSLETLNSLLSSGEYVVREHDAACCVLLERGQSAAQNAQVLRSLP